MMLLKCSFFYCREPFFSAAGHSVSCVIITVVIVAIIVAAGRPVCFVLIAVVVGCTYCCFVH